MTAPLSQPADQEAMYALAADVAHELGVPESNLYHLSRGRLFSWPRQVAMVRLRDAGFSYPAIAAHFGLKDHTTVIHAERAAADRLKAGVCLTRASAPATPLHPCERHRRALLRAMIAEVRS